MQTTDTTYELDWAQSDWETRFFFNGGRFTKVNNLFAGILATLLTMAFFAALQIPRISSSHAAQILTDRGPTQYVVVLLFLWSLVTILFKRLKLSLQRRALNVRILPSDVGFTISTKTVSQVLHRIKQIADDPTQFLLLNRIDISLSNLDNLGRIGDVEEMLRSQASQDTSQIDTSYATIQGFVWAIPVLGFIGTVLGLSDAIGSFTGVLNNGDDLSAVVTALGQVTGGLATAFDTTLVALTAALIVQILVIASKKAEEEFLDEAHEYCLRNIVARLRLSAEPQNTRPE